MGTKHSVPVTSTQSDTSTGRTETSGSEHAPPVLSTLNAGPSYGKLAIGTAAIRPHEMPAPVVMSPLDIKITNALKELKAKRALEDKKDVQNPFNRIVLKFPLVAQAFNSVRSAFEELDKGKKGYIVFSDMEGAFEKLGMSFSKEELGQVFQESDMLENGRLNFKEFLVCLAIGFVLHKIPSLESEKLSIFYAPISPRDKDSTVNQTILFGEGNKLRVAFQLAVDAFLWFDIHGAGRINRSEMASRLATSTQLHSPTKKMSILKEKKAITRHSSGTGFDGSMTAGIWEQRFNEMDWNHDGSIQFKEFLMAFESWVGLDEDDVNESVT